MRELIEAAYPEHGILGEEYGAERPDAEFVWVLDPIDGTKSFITGRPLFGTLIALCASGPAGARPDRPVASCGERWVGHRRRTAGWNGRPIRVRACPRARATRCCSRPARAMFRAGAERRRLRAGRRPASGCRCSAATATPTACWRWALPIWSSRPASQPYDFMALVPVIEGAGGRITDWQGGALVLGSDRAGRWPRRRAGPRGGVRAARHTAGGLTGGATQARCRAH